MCGGRSLRRPRAGVGWLEIQDVVHAAQRARQGRAVGLADDGEARARERPERRHRSSGTRCGAIPQRRYRLQGLDVAGVPGRQSSRRWRRRVPPQRAWRAPARSGPRRARTPPPRVVLRDRAAPPGRDKPRGRCHSGVRTASGIAVPSPRARSAREAKRSPAPQGSPPGARLGGGGGPAARRRRQAGGARAAGPDGPSRLPSGAPARGRGAPRRAGHRWRCRLEPLLWPG